MHRFLVDRKPVPNQLIALNPKESHHALSVLRVKAGEAVELLDGQGGRFKGFVAGTDKGRVEISVQGPAAEDLSRGIEITLAATVIKPDRMEWMLEKSCELGVAEWLPVLSERGIVKLSRERWQGKVARWKKIALESCKQCGQSRVPKVEGPVPFKELLKRIPLYDAVFIPTLAMPVSELGKALSERRAAKKVLVLIGPEGDFTQKEAEAAVEAGAVPVSLGPLVLRAETAAVYTLSVLQFFFRSPAESL